jgi:hypothetical protein
VTHTYDYSYVGATSRLRIRVQIGLDKNSRPYLKSTQGRKGVGVCQVVEHLPSVIEALSSSSVLQKKEGKAGREGGRKEGKNSGSQ